MDASCRSSRKHFTQKRGIEEIDANVNPNRNPNVSFHPFDFNLIGRIDGLKSLL